VLIDIHSHNIKPFEGIRIINSIFGKDDYFLNAKFYSIGIHPWYITDDFENQLKEFELFLDNNSPIAIGECGLDKLKGPNLEVQEIVFRKQIELSEEHQLPVIIHCVKAYDKVVKLKQEINPKMPWIIHGFNRKEELIKQLIKAGFYLSINEIKTSTLQIPNERLFLESDEKDINFEELYSSVSELKSVPKLELENIILNNFKTVFHDELAGKN